MRLVRLLDSPAEAPVLMPLILREIIYRLLMGKQGTRLRHLAVHGGFTSPIAKAVERLHKNFDQPLHIEELARESGMSVSGLQHHFNREYKSLFGVPPMRDIQRLREAASGSAG